MQNALSPSLKALIADQLLRHPDKDVKVVVASCFSEITRITAPEAPYDDDQMKVCIIFLPQFMNALDYYHGLYRKKISKSIESYR